MSVSSNPVSNPTSRRPGLFTWLGALCFSALVVPLCLGQNATEAKGQAVSTNTTVGDDEDRRPALPAGVIDILEIQPFRLKTGYHYDWLEGRPFVSDGLLVVLRVDPNQVVPRNTAEPVLYAGDRTVQRLNQGDSSGYVIGIIPGLPDEVDLAAVPIWFGRPELPERVTPKVIQDERELAEKAGIQPFGPDKVTVVRRDAIDVEDLAALLRGPAADLVLKFSPDEKDLVETWRLPTTGAAGPR